MRNDKKKKKIILPNTSKKKVKKVDPKQKEEQEQLIFKIKKLSPANKKVNRDEIVSLRGGDKINLDEYINENFITGRSTHYFKPFYLTLAALFCVDPSVMERFVKPVFVPIFKLKFILGRFPQRTQDRLKQKNKYSGYFKRKYYFYQLVTKKGDAEYRNFIKEAEEMAVLHKGDLKGFIVAYCSKYGLPIQLNLFDGII